MSAPTDWHSRGYLPHFDNGSAIQFITYRLADSLPHDVAERLSTDRIEKASPFAAAEEHLDRGYGSCLLRVPANAQIVEDGWKFFDGQRYRLLAWSVMPNHVHVLLEPVSGFPIASVVQTQKSYTAKQILRKCVEAPELAAFSDSDRTAGARSHRQVWQREYFDSFIRNAAHFAAVAAYIHGNPVSAGLVRNPEEWPWSSIREWGHRCRVVLPPR
jgi:REP element-mobilizing transposase RayT